MGDDTAGVDLSVMAFGDAMAGGNLGDATWAEVGPGVGGVGTAGLSARLTALVGLGAGWSAARAVGVGGPEDTPGVAL